MDMWHSNNIKVIVRKFAKDHWITELCLFYSFSCINSFDMVHNQAK